MEQVWLSLFLILTLFVFLGMGLWVPFSLMAVGYLSIVMFSSAPAGKVLATAVWSASAEWSLAALPLFKAAKFFLNPEMSLADCLVAPVVWRLPWLGVDLGREGKPIVDYGERLFHSQGFARSMTEQEKAMRP